MANIKAYNFTPRNVDVYEKIWDSKAKKVAPIKSMEMFDMHMVLDSITHAVEAGVVDTLSWPQQFFAKKEVFQDFIDQLAEYDESFRITDQWWRALAVLADVGDEEGFISTEDISNELYIAAARDGLLENWGKKNPAPKYTKEQYEEALFQHEKDSYSSGKLGLTSLQMNAMMNVIQFGVKHYEAGVLSKARRLQAQAEGTALLKKAAEKKSLAAKKKTK